MDRAPVAAARCANGRRAARGLWRWAPLLVLLAALACGGAPPTPTPTPLIELPRDHGYHEAPVEWWYFSGHLSAADNREYSFHFAGFNFTGVGVLVPPGTTARALHLSMASPEEGPLLRESRGDVGRGETPAQGFRVAIGDWSMSGHGEEFRLTAAGPGNGFDLRLQPVKDVVFHDGDGLLDMGPGGETYYYTYPRLRIDGQVTAGGATQDVSGQAWMDHQWGEMVAASVGWDWFSFQLDGNEEAMVFSLWEQETRQPVRGGGTFVGTDGDVTYLDEGDVDISVMGEWTSPRTGVAYPSGWRVGIPPLGLDLEVLPTHPDAEFGASLFNPLSYWEGQVSVQGTRDGDPVSGTGFVELVGYEGGRVPGMPRQREELTRLGDGAYTYGIPPLP